MNLLVLSDNDVELAIAKKMLESHHCNKQFIVSQKSENDGIGERIDLDINNVVEFADFCLLNGIKLVVGNNKKLVENNLLNKIEQINSLSQIIKVLPSKEVEFANDVLRQDDDLEINIIALTNSIDFKIIAQQNENVIHKIEEEIISPFIKNLQSKKIKYNGFLSFEVIKRSNNCTLSKVTSVIENDLAEKIFSNLETDLVSLFAAMDNGTLEDVNIEFYEN